MLDALSILFAHKPSPTRRTSRPSASLSYRAVHSPPPQYSCQKNPCIRARIPRKQCFAWRVSVSNCVHELLRFAGGSKRNHKHRLTHRRRVISSAGHPQVSCARNYQWYICSLGTHRRCGQPLLIETCREAAHMHTASIKLHARNSITCSQERRTVQKGTVFAVYNEGVCHTGRHTLLTNHCSAGNGCTSSNWPPIARTNVAFDGDTSHAAPTLIFQLASMLIELS